MYYENFTLRAASHCVWTQNWWNQYEQKQQICGSKTRAVDSRDKRQIAKSPWVIVNIEIIMRAAFEGTNPLPTLLTTANRLSKSQRRKDGKVFLAAWCFGNKPTDLSICWHVSLPPTPTHTYTHSQDLDSIFLSVSECHLQGSAWACDISSSHRCRHWWEIVPAWHNVMVPTCGETSRIQLTVDIFKYAKLYKKVISSVHFNRRGLSQI